ncbi:MAG: flagellar motor switch protein FliG [Methylococcales bacterium]|nr:flagellar motor switch protein FliG [Methylobacter sp.]MDP2426573.1 flagellar motor switch protein FliG [Methylobacter sp.]MDP3056738.1 flagellar motor switch protein FliG [Methylobacter sp.]MDP3360932.1 flagellar motor switch protein FliG [Methylobacter sp.]MDZ4157912.1 flagellar motor switch protein FliG [Methylococcales bacterium]
MAKAEKAEKELSQVDRAAILLLALGMDRAAMVLKHMSPREVTVLGTTMASVGEISVEMMDEVVEEFIIAVKRQTALGMDTDDYIRNVLISALGADKANSILDRILQGGNTKGIEQLKWMDTRSIADMIRLEHPQIVATIMSLMDSEQAADVVMFLPESMRADLMMRIATMKGIQPSALRELDQIMEQQLTGSDNVKSTSVGGIDAVANILNLLDGAVADSVMSGIAEHRSELAQEIQDKMFTFEDLAAIDERGMQTLLREVSTGQLLLAMRSVSSELKDKIFSNMSKRAAEMLRDDLEASPPAKLSEVELAQKDILAIAKKLSEAGEIQLGGGADELI